MDKLRPRGEKQLAQGHTACQRQTQDLNRGLPIPVPSLLSPKTPPAGLSKKGRFPPPRGCVCLPVSGEGAHRGLGAAVPSLGRQTLAVFPLPRMVAVSPLENLMAPRPTLRPDKNHSCECLARGGRGPHPAPHPGLPHSSSHLYSMSCSQRVSDLAQVPATHLRLSIYTTHQRLGAISSSLWLRTSSDVHNRQEDLTVFLKQTDENVWLQVSSILSPAPSRL